MLDTRCWILDAGYSMLDTGCWMLDAGYWMLDIGYLMLETNLFGWYGVEGKRSKVKG